MNYKIEKFRLLISFTIKFARDVQLKLKDGKLTVIECITLLPYLHDIKELVSSLDSLKSELKAMTPAELGQLYLWLESDYGINHKRCSQVIDSFFSFITSVKSFIYDVTPGSDDFISLPSDDFTEKKVK